MNNDNNQPQPNQNTPPGISFAFDIFPLEFNRTSQTPGSSDSPIALMMRNFVEILNRPSKHKHATKDAIDSLKPIPLAELPESEKQCPICFEPFEEYAEKHESQTEQKKADNLPSFFDGYEASDPDLAFPTDQTATREVTYSPGEELHAQPAAKAEDKLEDAHYPVKLDQCGHIFGKACVAEWLKSNVSCPLCRREIAPEMTESPNPSFSLVFYPVALTETFVPISWSGPVRTGYALSDPPINFPAQGEGFSMGRRTGPEAPAPEPQERAQTPDRTGSGGPTRNNASRTVRSHPYSRPSSNSSESEG
ncbi:hypothetical protein KL930_002444 [Ogataea haglerorum]|uniref:RING-type domain-containing protein n=1 Tax=Ogataea haglerorum TaxID=1937702 RepID=A0AAN6I211_9ASCO|nr:hypothetical protein KL915_002369 [Ogataea haglerorum]KAG7709813.1 hypothetical protein KL950_002032 [Ogataea haglerorum]KAG7729373.1 hypothetical protein KL933_001599 [Ogataea haglerorum]KAG7732047.1 hypothetical protein KL948_002245 [Ogataea haglerorum]KAG7778357.1 hypothetical protein KL930_002444 [Ogataea haglerorum]